MRQKLWVMIALLCLFCFGYLGANSTQAQFSTPTAINQPIQQPFTRFVTPTSQLETYTIQPGDTLYRIAVRFRTTVTALATENGIVNPSIIFVGQRLRIPNHPINSTLTPFPSQLTTSYTVARGDTLYRIAIRFNTTVSRLIALNHLANPNIIYVGQSLTVPTETTIPIPTLPIQITPGAGGGSTLLPNTGSFGFGVEAYLLNQDETIPTTQILELGVQWVKQEVDWRDLETTRGQIDFTGLDEVVSSLKAQNFKILLTISTSPAWARTSIEENGPPDNPADYATFVGALAQRYAGRVDAYEIWNEPNLRREWNSTVHNISPASYIELLRQAYNVIKTADSNAIVVSAGLAPTGFNDGVNAINDRQYLSALYGSGLDSISDAIGVHPNGWANPPDAVCCTPAAGVSTHYEDPSFYFLNTLMDYHHIMIQNNDVNTPIWVTRFGWGSSEGLDTPSATNIFLTYTSLVEQATYVPRGFELGSELGFVGPMFVYNFNGCQSENNSISESCYYSLIGEDELPRPVYTAIQNLTKSRLVQPPLTMTAPPTLTPAITDVPATDLQPTPVLLPEVTEDIPSSDEGLMPTPEAIETSPIATPEISP